MKKNILYIAMACIALGFTACSDDPEDAVSKHVYGPDEAPYLRADANATLPISTNGAITVSRHSSAIATNTTWWRASMPTTPTS